MDTIRSISDDKNSLLDKIFMERETQLNMIMDTINESRYETKDNKYKDISGDNDKDTPIFDHIIEEDHRKRLARKRWYWSKQIGAVFFWKIT